MPAPTVVQEVASRVETANGGSPHDLVTWTVTAGSTLVCAIYGGTANRVPSLSDSRNGAWSTAELESDTSSRRVGIFYFADAAAGSTTIQVAVSPSSNSRMYAWLWEITESTLDVSDHFEQSTNSATHPHAPTGAIDTAPNVWLCAVQRMSASTGANTPPSGWTEKFESGTALIMERASDSALTDERAINTRGGTQRRSTGCIASFEAAGGPVVLTVADSSHAHSAETPTLTQANTLAVADSSHAHALEAPALVQAHVLAVQSALHAHAAENVALDVSSVLAVQDALHAHTAETPALTQANVLTVEDALHAHTAEAPALVQASTLVVQDALHGHTVETPTLDFSVVLVVDDVAHAHTAETPTLSIGLVLAVQDALHAHTADSPSLTQANILIVDDVLHAHLVQQVGLIDDAAILTGIEGDIVLLEADGARVLVMPSADRVRLQ